MKPQQPNDLDRKSRVIVLPVDPNQVHVYWRIEATELREAELTFGEQVSGLRPVLRFHNITDASSGLKESDEFLDVRIELDALNSYVHLPKPSSRFFVDLGLRTEDCRFLVLARTTTVQTPPASPSENESETLMLVLGDLLLPHPSPGYRKDDPPKDLPIPHPAGISGPGNRSGLNLDSQRTPVTPIPTSNRPDAFDSRPTTGLALMESGPDAGSEASARHHLVERNERSFASGLSSILRGDGR